MKKSLIVLLMACVMASPAFAAKKKPAKPVQKEHPQYVHQKAPKKAVPAKDTSPMPKPPAPTGK